MTRYYSNGKLLITGEYLILDGALGLALPTKFGQDLVVSKIQEQIIIWESYTLDGELWFEATFRLPDLRLIDTSFIADEEEGDDQIAEVLRDILWEAKKMNPDFLHSNNGFYIQTTLDFPRDWGLGTSSSLINNIAQWANINPFELLQKTFGGSGYDIACAQSKHPINYQLIAATPFVNEILFEPIFKQHIYFIHLNKKQNSRSGIKKYQKEKNQSADQQELISKITTKITNTESLKDFEELLMIHEDAISKIIQTETVQQRLFPDYTSGVVKSLGAWGGDFVMVTATSEEDLTYFKEKGYHTILSYDEMILSN